MSWNELAKRIADFGRPKPPPLDLLNEAGQRALNSPTIGIDQAVSVVRQPHYDLLSPYFTLKLLDQNPHAQKTALSRIVTGIHATNTYDEAVNLLSTMKDQDDTASLTVNPKKVARVALAGPIWMEERMDTIVQKTGEDETPVILAYAGLFALKPVIKRMQSGDTFLIVIPDNIPDHHKPAGFKVTKHDNTFQVDFLTDTDLQTQNSLVFIDDIYNTGETFKQAAQAFPNAAVRSANVESLSVV